MACRLWVAWESSADEGRIVRKLIRDQEAGSWSGNHRPGSAAWLECADPLGPVPVLARSMPSRPGREGPGHKAGILPRRLALDKKRNSFSVKADAIFGRDGVDGVKDARWGFHTANQKEPWWQVDLGRREAIGRVVIYNRCDALAARNSRIIVLLGDDGKNWREPYRHDGPSMHRGSPTFKLSTTARSPRPHHRKNRSDPSSNRAHSTLEPGARRPWSGTPITYRSAIANTLGRLVAIQSSNMAGSSC